MNGAQRKSMGALWGALWGAGAPNGHRFHHAKSYIDRHHKAQSVICWVYRCLESIRQN